MKNIIKISALSLFALFFAFSASAGEVKNENLRDSISSNDYDAFVESFGERRFIPTEEMFDLMVEIYEAKVSEDEELVSQLREEFKTLKESWMEEIKSEMQEKRTAAKEAMSNGDYDAFIALVGDKDGTLTEEVFEKLSEIQKLREADDKEGARELIEELKESGFDYGHKKNKTHKNGRDGGKDGERKKRGSHNHDEE